MFDDLFDSSTDVIEEITTPSANNSGGFKRYDNNQKWQRKPEVEEEPYVPVSIFIDKDFPMEVKKELVSFANKLIQKGVTVRFNADEAEIFKIITDISTDKTEAYVPWKGFNDIQSKHYWNTVTAKAIAQANFVAWEKVPDLVKALMARNVRLLFGDKNNSPTKLLITWSPDGANKQSQVTRDTGRASFIIGLASKYYFPVLNVKNEEDKNELIRTYQL